MKNKIVVIDGKVRWDRKETIKAFKLLEQRLRKELKRSMLKNRKLDAFGNADINISQKLCDEMFNDLKTNISNMSLPKKYQNNEIYKSTFDVFKEGFKNHEN